MPLTPSLSPERVCRDMGPRGQSLWYLDQRPCGATFPVIRRDGPVTRWRIPPPGQTGGSHAAGMKKPTFRRGGEVVGWAARWEAACQRMKETLPKDFRAVIFSRSDSGAPSVWKHSILYKRRLAII
jgi:hypothetical protein